MIQYQQEIESAIQALEQWFSQNPFYGYDPFDIKGKSWIIPYQKYALTRKPLNLILELFPSSVRVAGRVRKQINSKGIALLALANQYRFLSTGFDKYLKTAEEYLQWLTKHRVTKYGGTGWGYPFDWQSNVLIPEGTPSSVVTAFCGEAFLLYRSVTKKEDYDIILKEISVFLSEGLNQVKTEKGICFSYTPVDTFTVHNANLFSAWFLVETGFLFGRKEWVNIGKKAVEYTLSDQNKDGSFSYSGPPMKNDIIDAFHTGYVMRLLKRISHHFPEEKVINDAISKGMDYYIHAMFTKKNFPKDRNVKKYPVNIHTLNEWIMIFIEFPEYRDKLNIKIQEVLRLLFRKMQYRPGLFAYKAYPFFKIKIPFFRWNQAWTFFALSRLNHMMKDL